MGRDDNESWVGVFGEGSDVEAGSDYMLPFVVEKGRDVK